MSPREVMQRVGTATARVMDLKGKDGQYAFGKVFGAFAILVICAWESFWCFVLHNEPRVTVAFLVVSASVGPTMLDKFFSRISIVIGHTLVDSNVKISETRREILDRRDAAAGIDPA